MKFHPMLFSTPMVQALLNGTKTQTRRTQGLESLNESIEPFDWQFVSMYSNDEEKSIVGFKARNGYSDTWKEVYQKINIGDIIWVRETMLVNTNSGNKCYVADGYHRSISQLTKKTFPHEKTIPSLFMTKADCRIWLRLTNIRVQKLQEITEEDAKAEGIGRWTEERLTSKPIRYALYFQDCKPEDAMSYTSCPIDSYESLWKKINGKESWDKNPFVWVYNFEIMYEAPFGFK